MNNTREPSGCYPLFLGIVAIIIVGYLVFRLMGAWDDVIAAGNKYIYISGCIFVLFAYLQGKQIRKIEKQSLREVLKSKEVGIVRKLEIIFCFGVGLLCFLVTLYVSYKEQFGGGDVSQLLKQLSMGTINFSGSKGAIFMEILLVALMSVLVSAFLFFFLVFGILTSGLSVSIAFHNWFNGMSFDLGLFLETVFDLSLSDTMSYVINILLFVLSLNFTGKLSVEPTNT